MATVVAVGLDQLRHYAASDFTSAPLNPREKKKNGRPYVLLFTCWRFWRLLLRQAHCQAPYIFSGEHKTWSWESHRLVSISMTGRFSTLTILLIYILCRDAKRLSVKTLRINSRSVSPPLEKGFYTPRVFPRLFENTEPVPMMPEGKSGMLMRDNAPNFFRPSDCTASCCTAWKAYPFASISFRLHCDGWLPSCRNSTRTP